MFHTPHHLPPRLWRSLQHTLAVLTTISMIAGGLLLSPTQVVLAAETGTVTARLNLRTEPTTSAPIIAVIPAGTTVSIDGAAQDGFHPVWYGDRYGWAHGDWISFGGGAPSTATGPSGSAWVTGGNLNLRSGPSTSNSVITIMPNGAQVSLSGEAAGGFYRLVYNGTSGWAHSDFLTQSAPSQPDPAPGDNSAPDTVAGPTGPGWVVAANLNLRRGPSTSTAVITVMPNGSEVTFTGEASGGFYSLVYKGTNGWASSDFLSQTAPGGPVTPAQPDNPAIGDTVVDTRVTTAGLNLRSGPATSYRSLTVIPMGATVEVLGDPQSGWYPVRYKGNKGWSHGDYLRAAVTAPAPEPTQPPAPEPTTTPTPEPTQPPVPDPTQPPAPDTSGDAISIMRTTVRLNVRSAPNTSSSIVTVLVTGASVEIVGAKENGFYPIRYGRQISGWAHGDFLTTQGASNPGPASEAPAPITGAPDPVAVGDTVVGTMTVTVGLNLRQGPGTNYNVILQMPERVSVSVMGDPVNGFYPVSFHGTKGWASGDYLRQGTSTAPNPGGGTYTRDEIIQIIYAAADKYNQPRADMLRVAQCESVLDPTVVNPASGVSGLFQFLPSTWATTPYADEDIFDPVANANAAGWMWSVGRRNEWHCQ